MNMMPGLSIAIRIAARVAVRDGTFTDEDRVQIKRGLRDGTCRDQIADMLFSRADVCGHEAYLTAPDRESIDWESMLDLLIKLLPVILQIVTAFLAKEKKL